MIIPIMVIVVGLVFFARSLGLIQQDSFTIIWPLLIVILGLGMLSHSMFSHHDKKSWWHQKVNWTQKKKG